MPFSLPRSPPPLPRPASRVLQATFLFFLWAAIYGLSLASPPLLDDADATHAQAAQGMLRTGDWVTLHVNGIRYLEKPPLPYWLTAVSLRLCGMNSFAVHLPLALTVLGLAALGWGWGTRAFGDRAGFYAALFTLTAAGVFLFTRIFIPDALLSLLLAFILYAALRALEAENGAGRLWAYMAWSALGAAVLTKGLVAPLFVFGAFAIVLPLTGGLHLWRRLRPVSGFCLFLAFAAPWHVLAGLRNRGGANGHGFFWFYFVNEHVLRFLGRRFPPDYNKLPATLFWSLHLVWLFPWSFFAPLLFRSLRSQWNATNGNGSRERTSFAARSTVLLVVFTALVLLFFSFSTNQEYYTFPVYLPCLLLTAAALADSERPPATGNGKATPRRLLLFCHTALAATGLLLAVALAAGLWSSRRLPPAHDVGDLLAHRGVGEYTLSMSHLFDLTTASFSALRLPAALACAAFALGPLCSLWFHKRGRHLPATVSLAAMSTVFLIAAHLAFVRFAPLLSSDNFARKIATLERSGAVAPGTEVLLFGDQAFGSSIPFYLGRGVYLVDGRSTSMLFGSTFPDAPPIFRTGGELVQTWGRGSRKLLFVPSEQRRTVDRLLGSRATVVYENAGKALFTDRPLAPSSPGTRDGQQRPVPEQ